MIHKVGIKRLKGYAAANERAIEHFKKIIREEEIECDLECLPAVLYMTNDCNITKLKREANTAKKLGIPSVYIDNVTDASLIPVNVKGAVVFENQAQFHPMKFLKAIADKVTIYENSPVTEVKGHVFFTQGAKVEAEHIVFATHYHFLLYGKRNKCYNMERCFRRRGLGLSLPRFPFYKGRRTA